MNSKAIEYLTKLGYDNISSSYYNYVKLWEDWYKNNLDSFHKYYDTFGQQRTMYSLGMAKRISEDWASVIYSERDEITTDKEQNKAYLEELKEQFNLSEEIPKCIEKATWSGTCGAIPRIKKAQIINGKLVANDKTGLELITVSAKNIVPLKVEHGKIIDVAIASKTIVNKTKAVYLEIHQLLDKGYKVTNVFLNETTGEELKNENIVKSFETGSKMPLFSLLMTPKDNPIEDNNGLGFSIYGDAIDQLKGCDITYHNFMMDFVLGGKKLIYNKKLTSKETLVVDGEVIEVIKYPDDISKQQFMQVGDEFTTDNKDKLIYEYNPELRVEDNKNGIQFSLDLASFKAGLGVRRYQFNGGNIVTATQYVGEQQDLIQNAKKYRDNLSKFISDIIKSGLLLARLVLNKNVTEECEVLVDNVDGFMQDEEAIKQSAREDLALGIISKVEYRMTVYHETEDVAKQKLAKLNEENTISNVSL